MSDTMQLSILDPDSVDSCDELRSLWTVNDSKTGETVGYLASVIKTYTSPSTGKTRYPVWWGFAVNKDEFRSGIQFGYISRKSALTQLMASVKS